MAQADTPADEQIPHDTTETPPSIQGRLSNSAPTDAFVDFVQRKKAEYKGRDGRGQQQHYVPLPELLSYWTNARIREACQSYSEGITTRHDLIRSRFLRVFSTLVYIGKLSYIPAFQQNGLCDQRFPDTTLPGSWIQSPSHGSMFDDFKAHQWTFFPVILNRDGLENTSLPPERILPLSVEETIRPQSHIDRAAITKVRFHPSCNDLVKKSDGTPASNPFYILKTYHGQHHEQHYRHEAQAFVRLPHDPLSTDHVIKCYAAFQHGETYNLVMEWVAGGDLLQYFQKRPPPRSVEDIIDFWDSLSKLNVGLHRIHQMILPGESTHQYQLVHQDIKPDNILLEIPSPSRPYRFSPIIADLGHSHIRHIRADTSDIPAVDRRGNQIYCAPESSHHSGFRRIGPNGIKWDADIFSAGAVFSDAASWVAAGEDGRKEYSRRRREELEKIKGFANSGYEIAFHNGSERLNCVDAMHRDIRTKIPSYDNMTPRVLDIIENHMMVLPKSRLQATLLYSKFEKEVHDVRSGPQLPIRNRSQSTKPIHVPESHDAFQEPETPPPSGKANRIFTPQGSPALSTSTDGAWDCEDTSTPTRSPCSPTHIAPLGALASPNPKRPSHPLRRPLTTPNPLPSAEHISEVSDNTPRSISETGSMLSMQDAADYRNAKKIGGRVNPRVEKLIEKLISNLEKRDHLFLIDDTESMKQHSDQIEEAFRNLAYIAKRIDPDHLELSFVSKPHHISKNRHTSGLIAELRQHLNKHVSVTGRIESSLSILITDRIMRRLPHFFPVVGHFPRSKPITIFVFTDGKWGEGVQPGSGLTTPINKLMQEMKSRDLNRAHVMFQFLRFGDDVEGIKHLAHLDDFGKKEKWDIVDTRPIGGDVYHMFLAALTEYHDNQNDSSSTDAE